MKANAQNSTFANPTSRWHNQSLQKSCFHTNASNRDKPINKIPHGF